MARREDEELLHGDRIILRTILEDDLDAAYAAHMNVGNRGSFFPMGVMSQPAFRKAFAEHGYWEKEQGMLLITTSQGEIAGHIEFFKPVGYWDAFELSYQLYDDRFAGRGYTTEAVQLLVDYLFEKVGPHYYDRTDYTFPESERRQILARVHSAGPSQIAGSGVRSILTVDGFKYVLEDGSWLLIRFSGTEPVIRIYAETDSPERLRQILDEGKRIAGL